jgi:hypothetical protein
VRILEVPSPSDPLNEDRTASRTLRGDSDSDDENGKKVGGDGGDDDGGDDDGGSSDSSFVDGHNLLATRNQSNFFDLFDSFTSDAFFLGPTQQLSPKSEKHQIVSIQTSLSPQIISLTDVQISATSPSKGGGDMKGHRGTSATLSVPEEDAPTLSLPRK